VSRQQNPLIQVKDLKKYYPVKTGIIPHVTDYVKAVDGVSFSIYEGEILGLVGESGCGKTTIGKLLTGLEKPTEGAILYRGMDVLDWTAKEQKKYRTKIQMIFQDPYSSLNPRKHIYEILAAPMLYHGISDKQTVEKDVKELLEMVGMPQSALGRYPHEFSGGQRQRIGIARALSLKPEFIVCDEPVSALDVSVQAQILNLLKSLQKELQLTLLFIGHGLGAVHYVSDRIAVMQNGRIVELGDAREVFHHPQQEYTKMLLNSILEPKAYSEDRDSQGS
jgi:ABC-type oligopeptide transport system ATPase subunit